MQQLRVEYWQVIGEVNLADLVFVDETGSNLAMTRRYARSLKGSRAYSDAPYQRGSNLSLIGAMALRGMVGEMTLPGATDGLAFKTYVAQVLVPNLWIGACVVMDNLPAHKITGIREAIEAVGARVVYLSPYSPDFSPIENCWSKVKEFLRTRAARTYAELDQAITDALKGGDDQGHYRLVHPLLLLYFTQLRTAVMADLQRFLIEQDTLKE